MSNEEKKQELRKGMEDMVLAIKLGKVAMDHAEPGTGDLMVEALLEEIGKLHSSYGKEKTEGGLPLRPAATSPDKGRQGDGACGAEDSGACGCAEESEWACCDCKNEQTYGLDFSAALRKVKKGKRIARLGWSGKGQFVILATDIEFRTEADLSELQGRGFEGHNALAFFGASGVQVGWLASQADMLSDDWYIVE